MKTRLIAGLAPLAPPASSHDGSVHGDRAFDGERAEIVRTRLRWLLGASFLLWTTSFLWFDLAVFPSRAHALAVRGPELSLAAGAFFWLRKPRSLGAVEAVAVFAWSVIAIVSGLALHTVPSDKVAVKVASLVLSVIVVCPLASLTWKATGAIGVVTVLSLTGLRYIGDGSLYTLTLTIVGFAYGVLIVSAAARDRLKRAEFDARLALRDANARLLREDELRRRLFVNLSHDLRTPLAIVKGEAELLRASKRLAEDDAALFRIEANAHSLTELADQLLDLARLEAGEMPMRAKRCDVAAVARDVAALLEPPGGTRRVTTQSPSTPCVGHVDPSHLVRMVSNLVANGLRHADVSIDVRREKDRIVIDVVDDGPGVPEAQREAIFQRFVSFDSDGTTASGIGLPLARELAALNGGTLDLIAGAPRTTFRLSLEASDGTPEADSQARFAAIPMAPTSGAPTHAAERVIDERAPRLLVVEDNADMATMLARVLGDHFRVDRVTCVADAIARLERAPPDAVLSDVLLPDGTGYDVLASVRGQRTLERLPFILVSALGAASERVRGLNAGADDYIAKPFATDELRTRLGNAISRAEGRRRALDAQRDGLLMEIHDGVSASLSRAAMLLVDAPKASESSSHVRDAILDGLDEVRAITKLLAPRASDWPSLTAEIRRATADACAAASIAFEFDADDDPSPLPIAAAVAHTIRRIAREATTNAIKHANARTLVCRMTSASPSFTIRIEDDGLGFPLDIHGGQGLGIMRKRVARLGGTLEYGRSQRGGALIEATLARLG